MLMLICYLEDEGEWSNHYYDFFPARGLFRRFRRSTCSDDSKNHKQSVRSDQILVIPREFKKG